MLMMVIRGTVIALVAVASSALACASDESDPPPFADPPVTGRDQNQDGAAYPTENLGGTPRAGRTRGDRIPNFTFQGYPDSNIAGGLKTVALADYFDPGQKRAKVLHLMLAAVWCPICDGMTREMIASKAGLDERGVVVVQALMDGRKRGISPSLAEVESWITRFPTPFTVVLDGRARRIGTIATIDAVPWSAFIDLRTMEILAAGVGRPDDYMATAKTMVDWVNTHPPSY
jgi:hypothetical protein